MNPLWRRSAVRERKAIIKRDSAQFAAACEALLQRGAKVRFRANGLSMRPNILNEDAVTVAPVEQEEMRIGDVALTKGEDGFRVHRVCNAGCKVGNVITRGDAGQENDSDAQTILGKVVAIERNGRISATGTAVQRFHQAFRKQIYRGKQAATLQVRKFATCFGLPAFLVALGVLLNAAPAAAQADLTMSQATSVSVVDTGINFNYTEIATNKGPNAVPAGTLVVYQQTPPNTTLQSVTVDANWNCSNPGAAGPIICIYVPERVVLGGVCW